VRLASVSPAPCALSSVSPTKQTYGISLAYVPPGLGLGMRLGLRSGIIAKLADGKRIRFRRIGLGLNLDSPLECFDGVLIDQAQEPSVNQLLEEKGEFDTPGVAVGLGLRLFCSLRF